MGTRSLLMAVVDGEMKVAQYSQWDGMPTGQGRGCTDFIIKNLLAPEGLEKFRAEVRECGFYTAESYKALVEGIKREDGEAFLEAHPEFSRDTGSDIFDLIVKGVRKLRDSRDFAADSLFCEWAYVLDLDTQMLEVYEGFTKAPIPAGERFSALPLPKDRDPEYYQVHLVRKYPFAELTDTTMQELEDELSKE